MTPEQVSKFVSELGYPIAIGTILIIGIMYLVYISIRWQLKMQEKQYEDHRSDMLQLHDSKDKMQARFLDAIDKVTVNFQNSMIKAEQQNQRLMELVEDMYKKLHTVDNKIDLSDNKLSNIQNLITSKRKI